MDGLHTICRRFCSLFHRRRLDEELQEEIRYHLDAMTQENILRGMNPASARAEARRQFGGVSQTMESYRDRRGLPILEETLKDTRYALRVLWHNPTATVVAVLALALGIGAVSCIFTWVNAVIRKPFPFEELDRLVRVWDTDLKHGRGHSMVSAPDFRDWKGQCKTLQHMSAFQYRAVNLTGVEDPERLQGYAVSASFFTALGMPPLLGRTFTAQEEEAGNDHTVLLNYGLWQHRFAADPQIVGKQLALNGHSYTVAGVMPADFDYPVGTDLWVPLTFRTDQPGDRNGRSLFVLARLQNGSGLDQAEAEMKTIAGRLSAQYPQTNEGHGVRVHRLTDRIGDTAKRFIAILMLAAAFVLLLACANVANIQLAQITSREREMALRTALGARPWRIARQLLAENIVLAAIGGIFGLLLALWGLDLAKASIPAQAYRWIAGLRNMKIDLVVLGFTAAATLATGIFFGTAPALYALRRTNLNESLKEGNRNGGAREAPRLVHNGLIVAEVALAMVLLVSAGLMVRTFQRLMTFDIGIRPENLLTMQISLPPDRYGEAALSRAFYEDAIAQLQRLPEVEAVGAANSRSSVVAKDFRVEGQPVRLPGEEVPCLQFISGNYFTAMGIPLHRGRAPTAQESGARPAGVVVISESVARRFWHPSDQAIGSMIHIDGYDFPPMTVIGVAGDVKDWFTGEAEETVYLANAHMPQWSMGLMVRTRIDPLKVIPAARRQIKNVDRNQPVHDIKSMEQILDEQTAGVRLSAATMSVFAVIAMFLAVSGIYGIVAYSVARRTQEIGVRMALGAGPGNVLSLMIGRSLRLTAAGLIIGLPAAYLATRLMSGMLYGVIAPDLFLFALLAMVLAAGALVAGYIPARRATRIDPIVALRCD